MGVHGKRRNFSYTRSYIARSQRLTVNSLVVLMNGSGGPSMACYHQSSVVVEGESRYP